MASKFFFKLPSELNPSAPAFVPRAPPPSEASSTDGASPVVKPAGPSTADRHFQQYQPGASHHPFEILQQEERALTSLVISGPIGDGEVGGDTSSTTMSSQNPILTPVQWVPPQDRPSTPSIDEEPIDPTALTRLTMELHLKWTKHGHVQSIRHLAWEMVYRKQRQLRDTPPQNDADKQQLQFLVQEGRKLLLLPSQQLQNLVQGFHLEMVEAEMQASYGSLE